MEQDISSFIEKILKKYNLEKKEEEAFNLLIANIKNIASGNPQQSPKTLDQTPSSKIGNIIKRVSQGEISERSIPEILKSELEIDQRTAREMAQEINMEGVEIYKALTKKRAAPEIEKKAPPKTPEKITLKNPIVPPKEPKKDTAPEFKTAPKKDLYREMPPEEEYQPRF